jgi:hypothetical protein
MIWKLLVEKWYCIISIIVVIVKTMFRFSLVPFKGPKKSQAPRKVSILSTGPFKILEMAHVVIFKGLFHNAPPHSTESIFFEPAPQKKALVRNLSAFTTLFAPGKSLG